MTDAPVVFVVDDDASVRSSLKFLLSTVGLQVESFDSADTFLRKKPRRRAQLPRAGRQTARIEWHRYSA